MITKEQFMAFVKVQRSGKTNMLDVRMVEKLGGPSMEAQREIRARYSEFAARYPGVV